MAKWLGLSPSSYCDKEKGRRRFTAAEAAKLCTLFKVGIEEVEDFAGEKMKNMPLKDFYTNFGYKE